MPGLVPGIHVFLYAWQPKTWMAGSSPAMTEKRPSAQGGGINKKASALAQRLAALLHLGTKLGDGRLAEALRPLAHVLHAGLDRLRLRRQQLLSERRLVEGGQVLHLLLGEIVGVDLRHLLSDLLLLAGIRLRNGLGDLVEVLLVVQVVGEELSL